MNELDGIPLILDSCGLDDSNPCILDVPPSEFTPGASIWRPFMRESAGFLVGFVPKN